MEPDARNSVLPHEGADKLAAESSELTPASEPDASKYCVLVVEDEILIRAMVSDELREAGHEVIGAYNADEALAVLGARVHVDLVVTDVRMPGTIDGLGLLSEIRSNYPSVPVILTSGHLEAATAFAEGAVAYIGKPYPLEAMVSIVDETLRGRS